MKYILLILLILLSSSCIYANELSFAQVSDVHYAIERKNPYQYRMIENINELLDDTIFQINSIENLDFVFFTGDQIDFSTEENLKGFIKLTDNLKYPWYFCFGNHDIYKYGPLTRKKYLSIVKNSYNCNTHKNYYSFSPKNGYKVIVLDSFEDIYKNHDTAIFEIKTQDTNLKEIQKNAKNLLKNSYDYEGLNADKNNIFTIKMK